MIVGWHHKFAKVQLLNWELKTVGTDKSNIMISDHFEISYTSFLLSRVTNWMFSVHPSPHSFTAVDKAGLDLLHWLYFQILAVVFMRSKTSIFHRATILKEPHAIFLVYHPSSSFFYNCGNSKSHQETSITAELALRTTWHGSLSWNKIYIQNGNDLVCRQRCSIEVTRPFNLMKLSQWIKWPI